jgi:hypothetical protein
MRFIGFDGNSIARVYGEHPDMGVAETVCREEAAAYVRRRPDTGPLSRWTFGVSLDDLLSGIEEDGV